MSTAGRPRLALTVASLASFVVLVDDSAVALALSSMGEDLGLGLVALEWVVNLYTLGFAVLTLAGGLLADRLGPRIVMAAGLATFAAVSLAAGLASSGAAVLFLRAMQGASAALVAPAALAMVTTATFPAARRGFAFGVWAGVSASALAAGPLIGAVLTQWWGWRSIFFVNVPTSTLLLLALAALPSSRLGPLRERLRGSLDVHGLLASGTALSALVFALTQASSLGWVSWRLWALLALALAAFAAFLRAERRAAEPLMDLSLFRLPNFSVANLLGLVNLAVMCSLFFFLALYLQRALLLAPVAAGVALLPFTALIAAIAPVAGRWSDRVGPRVPIVIGMVLVGVGLLLLSRMRADTGVPELVPGLLVSGVGLGIASTPVTTAALSAVPERLAGSAAAIVSVARLVGLALGVAWMGAIVAVSWPGGAVATVVERGAFAGALATGFTVNAALALTTAAVAMSVIRSNVTAGGSCVPADTAGSPE